MHQFTRRDALRAGIVGAVAASSGSASPFSREYSFHYDHVLGTSLDAWVSAPDPAFVERTVLGEIERLRAVFSLYDPESELMQLNRSAGWFAASPDLLAVLREYEHWQRATHGACNPRVGALVEVWKYTEQVDIEPNPDYLDTLARDITGPGWQRDGSLIYRVDHTLDLNSVAKGYILHRASAAVRQLPGVTGLLLNLGGDLCAWGDAPSLVGIQDPHQPYENAAPLTAVRLKDAAIATSGGYQRYFTIGGRRYSHLIDPRTGRPADHIASATVIAPTSTVANVLATSLCVLAPDEGLRLVAATPGTDCLIVTAEGKLLRSAGFAAHEVALRQEPAKPAKPQAAEWPADFQVTVALELPKMAGGSRYRRPYVAVWVENADGKAVRTISVWGNLIRWVPELSGWWKFARGDRELINAVCKATRAPGKYAVVWDGKDDKGNPVPQGTYTVKVEVHREHGKHVTQSGKIACGAEAAKATLAKNAETEETVVEYAKKKDKKDEKK